MKLTNERLAELTTPRGGFLAEVISELGENVMVKGWRLRLLGNEVSEEKFARLRARAKLPRLKNIPHGDSIGQTSLFQ